jgi:hypothetical protein
MANQIGTGKTVVEPTRSRAVPWCHFKFRGVALAIPFKIVMPDTGVVTGDEGQL